MRTVSRKSRWHAQVLGFRGRWICLARFAGFGAFAGLSSFVPASLIFIGLSSCDPGQRQPVSPGAELAPPVEPPEPGLPGCIESEPLQSYVRALAKARASERARALRALGATSEERPARFAEPGEATELDQMSERGKQRSLVVAQIAGGAPTHVALAKLGHVVRRIAERPRAHPVQLLVCG
ncbi:MAG TPA: hypothetical protein VG963_17640, partial [Polyangiaceae bacterium]|nr:hypothetical protein [Polyangiaceae bacterium]